jgi:hypothetical protein
VFAARLTAARAREPAPMAVADWRVVAEQLERAYPDHWAPVSPPDA